jgi:hypothetical protein
MNKEWVYSAALLLLLLLLLLLILTLKLSEFLLMERAHYGAAVAWPVLSID